MKPEPGNEARTRTEEVMQDTDIIDLLQGNVLFEANQLNSPQNKKNLAKKLEKLTGLINRLKQAMTNIYLPEAKKEETEEEVDITKQETIEQLVIIDIYNSENGLQADKKKVRTRKSRIVQKTAPPMTQEATQNTQQ